MDLAVSLREAGRYKEAITSLRAESAPDKALLAHLLSLDGQDGEAWSVLRAAQAMTPECPIVRRTNARLLLKAGQPAEALVEAEAACRATPMDAESVLVLAGALARNGRPEAGATVEHALRLRPQYAEALALRGMLRNAAEDLESALRLKPHLTQLWAPLATIHHRAGTLDKAKGAYLNGIRARPQADLHNNVGAILLQEGSTAQALEHFEQTIALNPTLAAAHSNRGKALKDMRRFKDAEAACRRAIDLDPEFAPAHGHLAVILYKSGRLKEAKLAGVAALSVKADFAEAQYDLANTLYFLDEIDDAKEAFRKAHSMAPMGIGLSALVSLACFDYAERDLAGCRRLLEASSPIIHRPEHVFGTSRIYWHYLVKLLKHAPKPETGETLHVIGDSHSLSAAGVVVNVDGRTLCGVPTLIMGCKQWHLGTDEPNEFKVKFERAMGRLTGEILLTIGEIDCRPTEGVFAYWRKDPTKPLTDIIIETVSRFVDSINRPVIVSGVPAPTQGEPTFVDCVRQFNNALRERALSRGLRFLDIHTMTDAGNGLSNRRWHLDGYHLIPDATREAFSKYLL